MRRQVAWSNVEEGPSGTVGRILCLTKDQEHTEMPGLFEAPSNAGTGALAFATMPGNSGDLFIDNVADGALFVKPADPDPVPRFRLCRLAFGRMWIANTPEEPGMLRPSMVGFWGTFPKHEQIYPDPTGGPVTGMWTIPEGMLVWTESSTFIVTENREATGFLTRTLNTSAGCVGPDCIATQPDGTVIWLGREGFYSYSDGRIELVSRTIEKTVRRINNVYRCRSVAVVDPRTGEYRCAVPLDGSRVNDRILCYDGNGWRERDDVEVHAACITKDHRQYHLVLGKAAMFNGSTTSPETSVYVMDHEAEGTLTANNHQAIVETTWLKAARSHEVTTAVEVRLWFRETSNGTLQVEVMKDWRLTPVIHNIALSDDQAPARYPEDDPPPFWDDAILGGDYTSEWTKAVEDLTWPDRRPYWVGVSILVPKCEVFKVRITGTGSWDFIGYAFRESAPPTGNQTKRTGAFGS